MSDVIDPNAIPIPAVNPEELETAAQAIKTGGEDIARLGHDIDSDWQGLSQFYRAPEADLLFAKIHPVAADGDSLTGPTKTVCDALTTFASTAKSLVADLNGLKSKAVEFRQKIDGDDDWHKDEDKVNEHNDLNNDIMTKLVAYQTAERDCANKITGLFGGTHFVGTDPTSRTHLVRRGDEVYGLDHPVKDVETPWGKPQEYDAPWYEDAWNATKDFGVGLAEDLSALVGMYGEDGWGWQGWDGLAQNWGALSEGLAGLVGLYGPDGWGWQGWGNLGDNWLNLVNAFVPYREWDGGRGAGYVITQSILNIGSAFVGAGVVKGVFKGLSATRGAEFADAAGAASKASVVGRAFVDGFKDAFKLPRISDLKASLDNIKLKMGDLRGLGRSLDEARHLNTDLPDTNIPDHEPAHVGGPDHPDHAGTDGGGTDGGGTDHGGTDHGGDHDRTDPRGDHDPAGRDHTTDPSDGHAPPTDGHTNPSDGHSGHDQGTPDPGLQKKLDNAAKLENGLRAGGLTQDQIDGLRGDLSPESRQWQRLASALNQKFRDNVQGLLHPKAIDFAYDGGRTTNPQTFAHRYEYFKARFDELRDQAALELREGKLHRPVIDGKSPSIKDYSAQVAAERLSNLNLTSDLASDLDKVHHLRPHDASVDPNLSESDLENALRSKAGGIDMGSDTSTAYHVRKHYSELPASERTGNLAEDYLNSAERTIRDGRVWRHRVLPDGVQEFVFRRDVVDVGGRSKTMEAIAIIRRDGRAILTTYGKEKVK